jgi:uncharacterized protein (TIGR00730 family)
MTTPALLPGVCVFLGSSTQVAPAYLELSARLGEWLARNGLRLVYGGARVGPMGALADAAVAAGGQVTGVIPRHLVEREVAHGGLPDLRVVETLGERKQVMGDESAAFVILPGGLGTLDEAFEVLTWKLLGLHRKPILLVNQGGFYDKLLEFLEVPAAERFIREEHRALWEVLADLPSLQARLLSMELGRRPLAATEL